MGAAIYVAGITVVLSALVYVFREHRLAQALSIVSLGLLSLGLQVYGSKVLGHSGHTLGDALVSTGPFIVVLLLLPIRALRRPSWLLPVTAAMAFLIAGLLAVLFAINLELVPM